MLHALGVAASERYNTLVEQEVQNRLGVTFVDTIGTTVRQRQQLSAQDEILAALSVDELADRVVHTVEDSRATWRRSHVAAEVQRIARTFANVSPGVDAQQIADAVAQAVMARVIAVTAPTLNPVPEALQRQDGESVYRVHWTERFTSARILAIEDSLIDAARTVAGFTVAPVNCSSPESIPANTPSSAPCSVSSLITSRLVGRDGKTAPKAVNSTSGFFSSVMDINVVLLQANQPPLTQTI